MIQKQFRRMMSAGILGATLLGAARVQAAPPTPRPETSLLGIRLLGGYKTVLSKFGQPTEIQVGSPTLPTQGQPSAGTTGNAPRAGGFPGGGYPGGGFPGGPPGGFPGGYPGAGAGGGRGGSLPGFGGGGRRGGDDQEGGGGGRRGGGGFPGGFPGGPPGGFPGGFPGGGYPGAGSLPGSSPNNAQQTADSETTWWYHFPKEGLHYGFLFNGKGEVIQIQAYGYKYKPPYKIPRAQSAQGITLGSSLGEVVRRYGFSTDGEHGGDTITLRYGNSKRVGFQLVRNQVVGITLAAVR